MLCASNRRGRLLRDGTTRIAADQRFARLVKEKGDRMTVAGRPKSRAMNAPAYLTFTYVLVASAYAVFLVVGLQQDWAIIQAIFSADDELVVWVSRFLPIIGRYKTFMEGHGYPGNVPLMENIYAICWLAFILLLAITAPQLRTWVARNREVFDRFSAEDRRKTALFGWAMLCTAVGVLYLVYYGFLNFDSSATHRERIHVDAWYALKPAILLGGAYGCLTMAAVLLAATKKPAQQR